MTTYNKVVLTGGAGLIGSHILDLLVDGQLRGDIGEIVVYDNFTRGNHGNIAEAVRRGKVSVVEGDIRDPNLLATSMSGADLLFHLAAIRITHCAADPRLAAEVLGMGTFNVAEAAVKAKVEKVVTSSSASVYGLADEFPTTERQNPYNNRTFYGALKTFNEGLFRSFNDMYGLPYVALRYFNVYGPRMDTFGVYTEVLIRWMEQIAAGSPPIIFGDGTQTMDFVYVTDIAKANILAARSAVTDGVFNIASGIETSLLELARTLCHIMECDLPPEHGPERVVNGVTRRLADTRNARDVLGFTAATDLETGLRDLVDWWRGSRAEDAR